MDEFINLLNQIQENLADQPVRYAFAVIITIIIEGLLLVGLMAILLKLISRFYPKT